ncbi:MAG: hypothetical protein FJY56_08185 [Betaproteobacteria bacterium]|nr:hypothetical protein [Betaproteobacteria bacterium]
MGLAGCELGRIAASLTSMAGLARSHYVCSGLPGSRMLPGLHNGTSWFDGLAAADMPNAAFWRMNAQINRACAEPACNNRLIEWGAAPETGAPSAQARACVPQARQAGPSSPGCLSKLFKDTVITTGG